MTVAIVIGAIFVVAIVVVVLRVAGRGRRPVDDIASFRRQIDALSPQARRETSDRMKPSQRTSRGDDGADEQ